MENRIALKLKRVFTITKKEFIHIRRDKPSLVISFVMPIMMLMIFGFAVNTDVDKVPMAIFDGDQTALSNDLIAAYENTYYFEIIEEVTSPIDAEKLIDSSVVKIGLVIPNGYSKAIKRGESADIQLLVDGSDPSIAKTTASYGLSVASQVASDLSISMMERIGQNSINTPITAISFMLYNPTLESSKFNVPGVVGLILQNITIILTALAMVREKELGTMEQLIMTPITSTELIVGKLIPYVVIGIYDFFIVMLLSYLVFGVSVVGNIWLLIVLGFIFLIGSLAMGMLISTVAVNQAQAIQGSLAFLLPSVLLSGFMFPRESMPLPIQWIGSTFPITHFLVILRGIILKGVGLEELMEATIYMLFLILLLIGLAAFKFSKKLD